MGNKHSEHTFDQYGQDRPDGWQGGHKPPHAQMPPQPGYPPGLVQNGMYVGYPPYGYPAMDAKPPASDLGLVSQGQPPSRPPRTKGSIMNGNIGSPTGQPNGFMKQDSGYHSTQNSSDSDKGNAPNNITHAHMSSMAHDSAQDSKQDRTRGFFDDQPVAPVKSSKLPVADKPQRAEIIPPPGTMLPQGMNAPPQVFMNQQGMMPPMMMFQDGQPVSPMGQLPPQMLMGHPMMGPLPPGHPFGGFATINGSIDNQVGEKRKKFQKKRQTKNSPKRSPGPFDLQRSESFGEAASLMGSPYFGAHPNMMPMEGGPYRSKSMDNIAMVAANGQWPTFINGNATLEKNTKKSNSNKNLNGDIPILMLNGGVGAETESAGRKSRFKKFSKPSSTLSCPIDPAPSKLTIFHETQHLPQYNIDETTKNSDDEDKEIVRLEEMLRIARQRSQLKRRSSSAKSDADSTPTSPVRYNKSFEKQGSIPEELPDEMDLRESFTKPPMLSPEAQIQMRRNEDRLRANGMAAQQSPLLKQPVLRARKPDENAESSREGRKNRSHSITLSINEDEIIANHQPRSPWHRGQKPEDFDTIENWRRIDIEKDMRQRQLNAMKYDSTDRAREAKIVPKYHPVPPPHQDSSEPIYLEYDRRLPEFKKRLIETGSFDFPEKTEAQLSISGKRNGSKPRDDGSSSSNERISISKKKAPNPPSRMDSLNRTGLAHYDNENTVLPPPPPPPPMPMTNGYGYRQANGSLPQSTSRDTVDQASDIDFSWVNDLEVKFKNEKETFEKSLEAIRRKHQIDDSTPLGKQITTPDTGPSTPLTIEHSPDIASVNGYLQRERERNGSIHSPVSRQESNSDTERITQWSNGQTEKLHNGQMSYGRPIRISDDTPPPEPPVRYFGDYGPVPLQGEFTRVNISTGEIHPKSPPPQRNMERLSPLHGRGGDVRSKAAMFDQQANDGAAIVQQRNDVIRRMKEKNQNLPYRSKTDLDSPESPPPSVHHLDRMTKGLRRANPTPPPPKRLVENIPLEKEPPFIPTPDYEQQDNNQPRSLLNERRQTKMNGNAQYSPEQRPSPDMKATRGNPSRKAYHNQDPVRGTFDAPRRLARYSQSPSPTRAAPLPRDQYVSVESGGKNSLIRENGFHHGRLSVSPEQPPYDYEMQWYRKNGAKGAPSSVRSVAIDSPRNATYQNKLPSRYPVPEKGHRPKGSSASVIDVTPYRAAERSYSPSKGQRYYSPSPDNGQRYHPKYTQNGYLISGSTQNIYPGPPKREHFGTGYR